MKYAHESFRAILYTEGCLGALKMTALRTGNLGTYGKMLASAHGHIRLGEAREAAEELYALARKLRGLTYGGGTNGGAFGKGKAEGYLSREQKAEKASAEKVAEVLIREAGMQVLAEKDRVRRTRDEERASRLEAIRVAQDCKGRMGAASWWRANEEAAVRKCG